MCFGEENCFSVNVLSQQVFLFLPLLVYETAQKCYQKTHRKYNMTRKKLQKQLP